MPAKKKKATKGFTNAIYGGEKPAKTYEAPAFPKREGAEAPKKAKKK